MTPRLLEVSCDAHSTVGLESHARVLLKVHAWQKGLCLQVTILAENANCVRCCKSPRAGDTAKQEADFMGDADGTEICSITARDPVKEPRDLVLCPTLRC